MKNSAFLPFVIRAAGELLFPEKCVRCGQIIEDIRTRENIMKSDPDLIRRRCLCSQCLSNFEASKAKICEICGRRADECECATELLYNAGIKRVRGAFAYDKENRDFAASQVIYSLKSCENRDTASFCAYLIADLMCQDKIADEKPLLITYAPRRKSSVRIHGGDHMKTTAKLLSSILGCAFAGTLVNTSATEQKKQSAEGRIRSAVGSIKLKRGADNTVTGKRVVVIDDIMTSGATLAACVSKLRMAGADEVFVYVLAKTVK